MEIKIEELKKIVDGILEKTGLPTKQRAAILDHVITAEIMGKKTHGVFRIPYIINKLKNIAFSDIKTEQNRSIFTRLDGSGQYALYVCEEATKTAIRNTLKNGFSYVCCTNYVGNTGVMGYYAKQLAESNLISIIFCNSEYAIAPTGGCEAILGTNPISFGFPSPQYPIIVDFATAAKTYGELMILAKTNKRVEYGIVLDADGNPSTDPYDAENGCQLPMAGHKGYGLSLAIEILAGLFTGGKAGKDAVLGSDGFVILSFTPDIFINQNDYMQRVQAVIDEIKGSKLASGYSEIFIPGERSFEKYNSNINKGTLNIEDEIYNALLELR